MIIACGGGAGCKNFNEIKNKKLIKRWREISHGGGISPNMEAKDGRRRWWSCFLRSGAAGFTW
jgi:hypothetical protein